MTEEDKTKKGKNFFLTTYAKETSFEGDMTGFQKRMRRVNNCKATLPNCEFCRGTIKLRCYNKTIEDFQKEALHKYHDTPQWRKKQEELNKSRDKRLAKLTYPNK